mgnify:CR=1 FL=1
MKRTPHETNSSWRTINRRALLIGGAQVGFAGLLALRMRHLQVDQADPTDRVEQGGLHGH